MEEAGRNSQPVNHTSGLVRARHCADSPITFAARPLYQGAGKVPETTMPGAAQGLPTPGDSGTWPNVLGKSDKSMRRQEQVADANK